MLTFGLLEPKGNEWMNEWIKITQRPVQEGCDEKDLPARKPPLQNQNALENPLSLGQHLKNQLETKKEREMFIMYAPF